MFQRSGIVSVLALLGGAPAAAVAIRSNSAMAALLAVAPK